MSLFSSDKPSSVTGYINVIADFKAKPSKEEEVRSMLSGLVEPTRREDGCKSYQLLKAKHTTGTFVTTKNGPAKTSFRSILTAFRTSCSRHAHCLKASPRSRFSITSSSR